MLSPSGHAGKEALAGAEGPNAAAGGGGGIKVRRRSSMGMRRASVGGGGGMRRRSSVGMRGGAAAAAEASARGDAVPSSDTTAGATARPIDDTARADIGEEIPGVGPVHVEDEGDSEGDSGDEDAESAEEYEVGAAFRHGAAAGGFANPLYADLPPEFAGLAALGGDPGLGGMAAYRGSALGAYEQAMFAEPLEQEAGLLPPNRRSSYHRMLDPR